MPHASLQDVLAREFAAAIAAVTGQAAENVDPQIRPAGEPRFGDYQCNAAMSLARALKTKPRDLAERIRDAVAPRLADTVSALEVAGPGFLNIRLSDAFLGQYLADIPAPPAPGPDAVDRVGLAPVERPLRVVVEYSQPNIAKQMHVGHLRSTIIGDVFARVLAFQGHEVVRQNHIGDWGTQFGMLIRWYREHPLPAPTTHTDVLEAIEADYRAANERFQQDEQFAREARQAVAELQAGDPLARELWHKICAVSLAEIDHLYRRLGVLLTPEDIRGESFYNEHLPDVIHELRTRFAVWPQQGSPSPLTGTNGIRAELREDQGALVVYLYNDKGEPLFRNPDGQTLGMIVQKSDGAYLYATTDLAAIRYRLKHLRFPSGGIGAQRVIYVTDARQKLHFEMFFACARAAGWIPADVQVQHVTFGSVLGSDRRPLKTRAGAAVKLRELLDEAERRALELIRQRAADADEPVPDTPASRADAMLSPEEIARCIGIAAVKYADLRNDRNSDYVFDWDKMLALQGNTAPYMMYAYARVRSIYRKAAERIGSPDVYAPGVRVLIGHPAERALALRLARLRDVIDTVAAELTPHVLCAYLYELAGDFMRFYEQCPVLAAEQEATRLARLRLCDLTARTLKLGLGLLGIPVLERM